VPVITYLAWWVLYAGLLKQNLLPPVTLSPPVTLNEAFMSLRTPPGMKTAVFRVAKALTWRETLRCGSA